MMSYVSHRSKPTNEPHTKRMQTEAKYASSTRSVESERTSGVVLEAHFYGKRNSSSGNSTTTNKKKKSHAETTNDDRTATTNDNYQDGVNWREEPEVDAAFLELVKERSRNWTTFDPKDETKWVRRALSTAPEELLFVSH